VSAHQLAGLPGSGPRPPVQKVRTRTVTLTVTVSVTVISLSDGCVLCVCAILAVVC
jgi:hypothetical protein